MPEIEYQNGTVEVEEGDTINITYETSRGDMVSLEETTARTVQGASFMGYSIQTDGHSLPAHDEKIETLEVL